MWIWNKRVSILECLSIGQTYTVANPRIRLVNLTLLQIEADPLRVSSGLSIIAYTALYFSQFNLSVLFPSQFI